MTARDHEMAFSQQTKREVVSLFDKLAAAVNRVNGRVQETGELPGYDELVVIRIAVETFKEINRLGNRIEAKLDGFITSCIVNGLLWGGSRLRKRLPTGLTPTRRYARVK